jgi:hypothetical protein
MPVTDRDEAMEPGAERAMEQEASQDVSTAASDLETACPGSAARDPGGSEFVIAQGFHLVDVSDD